jgi:hypothetical protein
MEDDIVKISARVKAIEATIGKLDTMMRQGFSTQQRAIQALGANQRALLSKLNSIESEISVIKSTKR